MPAINEKLDAFRNRVAQQEQERQEPQMDPKPKQPDLGGRPRLAVPTQPLNLRIPVTMMRELIDYSHGRSITENRVVTAQTVILELVKAKLAEKPNG